MKPTLLLLAAGMGSRYGGLKQLDAMGPHGEVMMDYSVFDARRAGFGKVVFVIRRDFEQAFREKVTAKYEGRVPVDFAFQTLEDVPAGFAVPEGREKPWGTAHAVLAARELIQEPFAMLNADDFYGRKAFEVAVAELSQERDESEKAQYGMVGFQLKNTLSEYGSVARGICRANERGFLTSVKEMTKIVAKEGGVYNEEEGQECALTGEELASMNFWLFRPSFFQLLERSFVEFLRARGGELTSEWYVPAEVDKFIQDGKAEVRVRKTESPWFGVTYQEDRPQVIASIQKLIDSGEYPERLF
ncbi:MAG: sugar phosphate nucleotidyltransferase [Verrucomicrobiota bacterium]